MTEIWKKLPKHLNLSKYIVSSHGNVKHIQKNKCLKLNITKHTGYIRIPLMQDNGKPKSFFIHRLIAFTFLKNPNKLKIVDHINNIKYDNKITNIRWVNSSQNANNRLGKPTSWKRKINQIKDGNIIKSWDSIKEAIESLKFPSIANYINKQIEYNGFFWESNDLKIDNEIWKDISINNKIISVSNMGRIKTITGKITIGTLRNGYLVITVLRKPYYVHRIVCSAFFNKPLDEIEVADHLDNNRTNNKLDNLNITSNKANLQKSLNKIVEVYDSNNEYIETYQSLTELCKNKNFHIPNVCIAIKNKKCFNGYICKYKLIE